MHSPAPPVPALPTIWRQSRYSPACPPPRSPLAGGPWRRGQHRFGMYGAGTAVTMLATMALAGAGFGQSPRLNGHGGLFQGASIITGFCLAHSPVRASAPADAHYRSTTPPGRLSVPRPPEMRQISMSTQGQTVPLVRLR